MKTIKILSATTIILCFVYLIFDYQLYYYGKNDLNIYNSLPMNIRPHYRADFNGGFVLEDEFGFYLISNGQIQYKNSSIKLDVKDIVKYGYDDNIIIVQIINKNDKLYLIKFFPDNKTDNISAKILNENEKISDKLNWIYLEDNTKLNAKELLRNYLFFAIIIIGLFVFLKLLIFLYNSKKFKR